MVLKLNDLTRSLDKSLATTHGTVSFAIPRLSLVGLLADQLFLAFAPAESFPRKSFPGLSEILIPADSVSLPPDRRSLLPDLGL